ncbi:sugar ABC transporter ATP-binding protein [Candidatus Bipolaricaulota bacterium]|nr:sugar ABC transporter ATP-binding protein [Candidatus Bipolaricaulota bacterium]
MTMQETVQKSVTTSGEGVCQKRRLMEYRGMSKSFGGVHALRDVSFSIDTHEIHGLIGENGAGKSTLIKVTGGVYSPDTGQMIFDGQPAVCHGPRDAEKLGIQIVHQEVPICENLTVAENIFLDPAPPHRGPLLDRAEMIRRSAETLRRLGIDLDPKRSVSRCSAAERQLVLIAKSLVEDAKLVILDEATSSLSEDEVSLLFGVLRKLRSAGTTFVFVSHRLNEVIAICDRITVLRNGKFVSTEANPDHDVSVSRLTELIVGCGVTTEDIESAKLAIGNDSSDNCPRLRVRELCQDRLGLKDISFDLAPGEVLGLAGLRGAGRTELLECLFGVHPPTAGQLILDGESFHARTPRHGIRRKMAYLTESRADELFYEQPVRSNASAVVLDDLATAGFIDRCAESRVAEECVRSMQVSTPSIHAQAASLSGGNQQKVLLGRWLAAKPSILLLDEPTRGIDVGAKMEIRRMILELAAEGVSAIYVSLDSEELVQVASRILVMANGRIVAELRGTNVTVANVVHEINVHQGLGAGCAASASGSTDSPPSPPDGARSSGNREDR